MDEIRLQRSYYATTADRYDESHLSASEPEHDLSS